MRLQGNTLSQILHSFRYDNLNSHLILQDIYNLLASIQVEELNSKTPTKQLLKELEKTDFNLKYYKDLNTNRLQRLFFTHFKAVAIFKERFNIILIDCIQKTNRFRMLLLNIYALTRNKTTIQVALCFLSREKKGDYK